MANEKRLIDANAFKSFLCKCCNILRSDEPCEPNDCNVLAVIDEQPTVDAVEVVRCKDCKHYDNSEGIQWCHLNSKFFKWGIDWHCFPEDGFCSYGERR